MWYQALGAPKAIRLAEGTEEIEGGRGKSGAGKGSSKKWNDPKELVLSREPTPLWLESSGSEMLLPLLGQCFTFNDSKKEYTYSFCPFHNISQASIKNKKNRFLLGIWGFWHASRSGYQVYDDGDQCGNVSRQVTVDTVCGASDFQVGNLTEPSTCNYTMEFRVPIPCDLMPHHGFTTAESRLLLLPGDDDDDDDMPHTSEASEKKKCGSGSRFFSGFRRECQNRRRRQELLESQSSPVPVRWSWPWDRRKTGKQDAPEEGATKQERRERIQVAVLEAEIKELKQQLGTCKAA
jgi:hypothetical protein